jgi:glucose-1-phosphate thymidylyltransferase
MSTTAPAIQKGIVLAGGTGTRMHPMTRAMSKQLLAIYDKPLVYYPLSVLMLAGIRDVLLISTPDHVGAFQRLLGDGSSLGIHVRYQVQPRPEGLPQAFVLGREFIGDDSVALVLGDNIFYGRGFQTTLQRAAAQSEGGTIFVYEVKDPGRFGVVEFDAAGNVVSLEEKPAHPKSRHVVTGLYFFDNRVVEIASGLKPSARSELEITDVIRAYWKTDSLRVELLSRGFAWLDTGTPESMLQAANFVQTIEQQQGMKIACLEEIAWRKGFITATELRNTAAESDNEYNRYLLSLLGDSSKSR